MTESAKTKPRPKPVGGVVNSASYATVAGPQTERMDRIQYLSVTVLDPADRRLDWVQAIAFAIDAYDNNARVRPIVDAREALRDYGPSMWSALHNRAVAIKVFEHLRATA